MERDKLQIDEAFILNEHFHFLPAAQAVESLNQSFMEDIVKEELRAKAQTYAVGGACGAIIILIAGFWVGPLTTNGALTTAVDVAVKEQQAQFCAERGRAAPAYVDAATFKALDYSEKSEFASRFGTFDGQTPSNSRNVANACRAILETA